MDGEDYLIGFAEVPETGWSYVAAAKLSNVLERANAVSQEILSSAKEQVDVLIQHMRKTGFILLCGVVLIFILSAKISQRLSNKFVKPILELSDGARDIAAGNFDRRARI